MRDDKSYYYAWPRLTARWLPVWRRNFRVWVKLAGPAMLGNFGEPLLYLLALGYGLGTFVGTMDGIPYIQFLAAGIVCSSAMTTATFEGLYSAYTRMAVQKTWDGMLATPLTLDDIVVGEVVWAGTKAMISAGAILVVAALLGAVHDANALWIVPVTFLTGICFGAMALVITAFSRSYDFFLYYFTLLITPMMLFSGVFFPLAGMPTAIQNLALALPLAHTVTVIRPLMTGHAPPALLLDLAVIAVYAVAALYLAAILLRRRIAV